MSKLYLYDQKVRCDSGESFQIDYEYDDDLRCLHIRIGYRQSGDHGVQYTLDRLFPSMDCSMMTHEAGLTMMLTPIHETLLQADIYRDHNVVVHDMIMTALKIGVPEALKEMEQYA